MSRNLKNIFVVSASTMGSRVLGLLRDVMTFAFLGLSAVNSAFIFAFTIPNLFRRLLGEGALTSALIPVFSHEMEKEGQERAYKFLNQALTWAFVVLLGLVLIGMVLAGLVHRLDGLEQRYYLGAEYLVLLLPYMIAICIAALLAAVLNVMDKFTTAALSQVWLNTAMIVALVIGAFLLPNEPRITVICLCMGILFGGLLQVIIPAIRMMKLGWKPRFDFEFSEPLRELLKLLIPGLAGASIFQINIAVSRFLAFSLGDMGVSVLYLANRLIELPLGVFAIAVTTVIFPLISKLVAKNCMKEFGAEYGKGLRMILLIMVPAAVGLVFLSEPILGVLFQWGYFGAKDVAATQPILVITALGLPFYGMATLATRGLHAMKDMKTPYQVALWSFGVNLVGSLVLMNIWGIKGLAAANVGSAVVQALLLHIRLVRKGIEYDPLPVREAVLKISMCAAVMGTVAYSCWKLTTIFMGAQKFGEAICLSVAIPLCVGIYFSVLWVFDFHEKEELKEFFLNRSGAKS